MGPDVAHDEGAGLKGLSRMMSRRWCGGEQARSQGYSNQTTHDFALPYRSEVVSSSIPSTKAWLGAMPENYFPTALQAFIPLGL